MSWLELPHSAGCLVCGRSNPLGMKLHLEVEQESGEVRCHYTPRSEHVGFERIVHGGAISTVVDEAMVWAATWRMRRFCVCGELTVRFRQPAGVGQPLVVLAHVESARPRLIETRAEVLANRGEVIARVTGKYLPVTPEQHADFLSTMIREPATAPAYQELMRGSNA